MEINNKGDERLIKKIAVLISDNWLMCPEPDCQEVWENKLNYGMVRCPKCKEKLHNPNFNPTV